jgi:hypothetical protein
VPRSNWQCTGCARGTRRLARKRTILRPPFCGIHCTALGEPQFEQWDEIVEAVDGQEDVAKVGGLMNLDNFRRREWAPAIEAAGIRTPARIYDLRSTFASDALAAGVPVFELARIMGTSVRMIERHYGALLDGAGAGITTRLDALDAERHRASDKEAEGV